ncbi:hypothetical protein BDN70DRAFT_997337 [Pholiota conissans]|uniref:Fe2OG dioxygenase domain-containing protein n=1 Tax=Pholiota conissans TaxID=109636 RepID=A0A9P5YQH2_9AGAR|nr:hypothetical protein BDN70DRAFT_997337 [Pholiota conissans]
MPSYPDHPMLSTVQDLFGNALNTPYCTGTIPLTAPQSLLFYNAKGGSGSIDFSNPTEAQLKALASACSPTSSGKNKKTANAKSGSMDPTAFCTHFSPWDSGVFQTVVDSLLKNEGSIKDVKVELYKLDVYGPGASLKTHVNPRDTDMMFGSLVVILPTPHTGGSMLFRHHDTEYIFDPAAAMSGSLKASPQAAFAASFNDVEHELTEITSGFRVALTYNLYHLELGESLSDTVKLQSSAHTLAELKTVLSSVLGTRELLPDGGLLAFALSHEYPFIHESEFEPASKMTLAEIDERLRGVDKLLLEACEALNLDASLKALYCMSEECTGTYCFMDEFVKFEDTPVDDLVEYLSSYGSGTDTIVGFDAFSIAAKKIGRIPPRNRSSRNGPDVLAVIWAKPLDDHNSFQEKYIARGNETSMDCVYGKLCIVVHLDAPYQRVCR